MCGERERGREEGQTKAGQTVFGKHTSSLMNCGRGSLSLPSLPFGVGLAAKQIRGRGERELCQIYGGERFEVSPTDDRRIIFRSGPQTQT